MIIIVSYTNVISYGNIDPSIFFDTAVHYRGWIKETGDKFYDTWEEGQPAEIVIGHGGAPSESLLSPCSLK